MRYQLIALLCVVAACTVPAIASKDEKTDVPQLGGAVEPFKRPYFGSRYNEINSYLMKNAASDEPKDVIGAAKTMFEDMKKSRTGSNTAWTTKELSVYESLDHFVDLQDVVRDLANKQCTRWSQVVLEWGERHTKGNTLKANLRNDRYAGTVRKLILQRAELCQDLYPQSAGYHNVLGFFNQTHYEVLGELYVGLVGKLISQLKDKKKFVPYVIPKNVVEDKLGETIFYTIIEMAKQTGDDRGEQLENLDVDPNKLVDMLEQYIFNGGEIMKTIGNGSFTMATMDKRVAGEKAEFSWMKDDTFVRRLEAFLFKFWINENKNTVWKQLKEFLKRHEGGRYMAKYYPEDN